MKAFYTLTELGTLIGKKNKKSVTSFLIANNIPHELNGNKYIIFISDIERHCPRLFDSLQLKEEYDQINTNQDKSTDNE